MSVLKLSTLWDFQDVRSIAIDNLPVTKGDDPIARIELARIYKVRQWFLPALQMFATQEYPPVTTQDVERLGLQFTLNVAELRGRVKGFNRGRGTAGAFGSSSAQVPVVEFIEEFFPAAIMSETDRDDSRPWDPMTLCFLSPAEDLTLTAGEHPIHDIWTLPHPLDMAMPAEGEPESYLADPEPVCGGEQGIAPPSPPPQSRES